MRDKLLAILHDSGSSYISGQEISDKLGISRTAVWKHIEELRKKGYKINAVTKKGYKMEYTPNSITADEINAYLDTKTFGRVVHSFDQVNSTQIPAHEAAREDAPEGTIVVAEEQLKGKGRMGRPFHSPKGTGLWCSLILRPSFPPQQAPQLTLLTAVAIAEGVRKVTDLPVDIKWPNDLLIADKKIAGILIEMQSDPDEIHAVIVGFGLNINQKQEDFPEDIQSRATSLAIAGAGQYNRAQLLAEILKQYEYWYFRMLEEGFGPVREKWEALAVTIGKYITAVTTRKTLCGLARGITKDGVLLLETEDGKIEYIYSADIHEQRST
ncbi:BirA family biotin operon repressor/biotin-[acetyl-CoA-carboxylase] ligase [Sinobaca qinghaiensis]|uniref:Bifunctional ligase/repressor BirA n=1 Tax=Sinobaca qinghaiensis TaxID=342944 RepID=A0A419V2V6_9BACL|nr:biotin--[acetyl-CoA-carboxylase] ligase [Sinobaca qinghaiensis]RKD72828.1 BirA family biotin operon repressor/biotin-[acetyl-CoA-carboxylase] ligase [Sinobaca qinghaiensis]